MESSQKPDPTKLGAAAGWLGLSPRSPGRGIEDSATATRPRAAGLRLGAVLRAPHDRTTRRTRLGRIQAGRGEQVLRRDPGEWCVAGLGLVVYVAVLCAAARDSYPPSITVLLINSAVMVIFLAAGVAGTCSRSNRPFWCGFYTWGIITELILNREFTLLDLFLPESLVDECSPVLSVGAAVLGGCLTRYMYNRINKSAPETSATSSTIEPKNSN